jgi:flagellar hook-associated protein 3 FlgL
MNRISTFGNYTLALANLTETQLRQLEAGRQISSQKIAQDLKGYAGKAEALTSMRALQTRLEGLLDQNTVLQDRFTTQDVALNQLADTADGARMAITDALASDRVDTLMQELRGFFTTAVTALNTTSQGRYIFAGGQVNLLPVTATSMSDLTLAAPSTYFRNDRFIIENQIDETSTISGGMLADDLGLDLFNTFRDLQAFHEGPDGPFTGQMTEAQRQFLQTKIAELDQWHENSLNAAARNGSVLKRLENVATDLGGRADTLQGLIGKVTDVDLAEAISRLQAAQVAVQASAQVFNTLRDSSLLNYLKY